MQGAGSIDDGAASASGAGAGGDNGGILHMAAQDIFGHIAANSATRVFLVRVSFIEIYNEEVRDLMVDTGSSSSNSNDSSNVLAVREDPRRGVFVNAAESIVTDLDGLLATLFAGEKNRHMASTGMNERSSRSHTIFRITVESRKKVEEGEGDGEDENAAAAANDGDDGFLNGGTSSGGNKDSDGSAVLVSTLNLVDLVSRKERSSKDFRICSLRSCHKYALTLLHLPFSHTSITHHRPDRSRSATPAPPETAKKKAGRSTNPCSRYRASSSPSATIPPDLTSTFAIPS